MATGECCINSVFYIHLLTLGQFVRSLGRLTANNSYFFLCDMQEKFHPTIRYFPEIITVAKKMVCIINNILYQLNEGNKHLIGNCSMQTKIKEYFLSKINSYSNLVLDSQPVE